MRRIAVLALIGSLAWAPGALAAPEDPLAPIGFLEGEWSGEGKHPYGAYQETHAFFSLLQRFGYGYTETTNHIVMISPS